MTELSKKTEKKDSNSFYHCLLPLLDAMKWRGEKSFIRDSVPLHALDSMNSEDMLVTMANLGFESFQFRSRIDKIPEETLPCFFISYKNEPFVILHNDTEGIFVFDGTLQEYVLLTEKRKKGTVMFFHPVEDGYTTLLDRQPYWFVNLIARFKPVFLYVMMVSFLLTILTIISPLFIMFVYDQVQHTDDLMSLKMLSVAIGIYILAFAGATHLQSAIMRITSIRFGNIVSNQVIRRVLYLPLSFTEVSSLSSQLARIKDFLSIQTFLGGQAFATISDLPFIILLLLVIYVLGGNIVIVPLSAFVIFAVSYYFVNYFSTKVIKAMSGVNARRQDLLLEILTEFKPIKLLGRKLFWEQRFEKLSSDFAFQKFREARVNSIIAIYSSLLVSLSALLTIYLGVLKVLIGELSPGGLMAVMILVWRILGPMKNGFSIIAQSASLKRSIAQLNRLMNLQLETAHNKTEVLTKQLKHNIEFSKVALKYLPESEPALAGVDAAIQNGESLTICGHEGAGKSSLMKLLTHLYTIQSGRILINGINVKQLSPVLLRKSLTFIPQKIQLFSGTIEQNLKSFYSAATEEDIMEAVKKVGLFEDIENFPDKLQTVVNEQNKSSFSEAFVKKLFIAAAILRKSNILIIDETTKDLCEQDMETLTTLFKELKSSKILIFITNQKPIFEITDKVLWLDSGHVRKFGPSEEVINDFFETGEAS